MAYREDGRILSDGNRVVTGMQLNANLILVTESESVAVRVSVRFRSTEAMRDIIMR